MADTINTLINGIENSKGDIADAIENKGVTVPSGTKLSGMANLIDQISVMHGPESSTDGNLAAFDGAGGDTLKDSGIGMANVVTSVNNISPTNGNVTISIPTVNNGTLTIQGNGTTASTFTANQSGNTTLNFKGSGATSVTKTANNEITISTPSVTDTNQTVKVGSTTFGANDAVGFVAGTNITSITADTSAKTITINAKDTTYSDATTSASGLMSASDKTKLNGIASGAEVNVQSDWNITDSSSDAYIKNKPSIPAAQVNSDWDATSGVAQILNKPTLATVATSGSYNDLTNKPTIPATNVIPATSTANKMLVSTTTSGTAKWSDWSSAGFLKTNTSGVVSVDTNTYLTTTGKAADSDKLDGNDSSYFQKALPTTSTAGKVLKSTSTAGTVEWGDDNDTNYYPSRSYTTGLQISTSQGIADTCALYVPNATASQSGVITTGAQTFAGNKTFANPIYIQSSGQYPMTMGYLGGDSTNGLHLCASGPNLTLDTSGACTIIGTNTAGGQLKVSDASNTTASGFTFTDKYKATGSSTIYTSTYTFPTKQADGSYTIATTEDIPTKTSDLTNDSGFVTSDTKNTAGSTNDTSLLYLIGAKTQAANPQTYSRNNTYINASGVLVNTTGFSSQSAGSSSNGGLLTLNQNEMSFKAGSNAAKLTLNHNANYGSLEVSDNGGNVYLKKTGSATTGSSPDSSYLLFPNVGTSSSPKTIATTDDIPNNSNIENGSGTNAVQEKMTDATVNFTGRNAHAEALDSSLSTTLNTGASGNQSAAFGKNTMALSTASFTNGNKTVAKGEESHAEGYQSVTLGDGSHAEGSQTVAAGLQSHSEGALTQALGDQSHAEGHDTIAAGLASHAEGSGTKIGSYSPASNQGADQSGGGGGGGGGDTPPEPGTFTAGEGSHAEGYSNLVVGFGSHAEGLRNYLTGNYAHIEGVNNTNSADYAHVEGYNNINSGEIGHVEGNWNNNSGYSAHVFGHHNVNTYSHKVVFGWYNLNKSNTILEVGKGDSSTRSNAFEVYQDGHAEVANVGTSNNAITTKAYVDGGLALKSSATNLTNGTGAYSLKQADCTSSNSHSFAEGFRTAASGNYSHAEGADTAASADYAHAEGANTVASGVASHASGLNTNAKLQAQTVIGKFNADAAGSLFVVGNGGAESARSNAFIVYSDGHAEVGASPAYGSSSFTITVTSSGTTPIDHESYGVTDMGAAVFDQLYAYISTSKTVSESTSFDPTISSVLWTNTTKTIEGVTYNAINCNSGGPGYILYKYSNTEVRMYSAAVWSMTTLTVYRAGTDNGLMNILSPDDAMGVVTAELLRSVTPTKTSDLANDSDYTTTSAVNSTVNNYRYMHNVRLYLANKIQIRTNYMLSKTQTAAYAGTAPSPAALLSRALYYAGATNQNNAIPATGMIYIDANTTGIVTGLYSTSSGTSESYIYVCYLPLVTSSGSDATIAVDVPAESTKQLSAIGSPSVVAYVKAV